MAPTKESKTDRERRLAAMRLIETQRQRDQQRRREELSSSPSGGGVMSQMERRRNTGGAPREGSARDQLRAAQLNPSRVLPETMAQTAINYGPNRATSAPQHLIPPTPKKRGK